MKPRKPKVWLVLATLLLFVAMAASLYSSGGGLSSHRLWAAFICSMIAFSCAIGIHIHDWISYRRMMGRVSVIADDDADA